MNDASHTSADRIEWVEVLLVYLPLAKLLGAHRDSVECYNTSGGYLSMPIEEVLKNIDAIRAKGIGGIKQGRPAGLAH